MNNTSYISISNNFSNLNINLLCKVYKTQFINSIAETTYIVHVINSIAEVQLHMLTHSHMDYWEVLSHSRVFIISHGKTEMQKSVDKFFHQCRNMSLFINNDKNGFEVN